MCSHHAQVRHLPHSRKQHGAALLVMLIILIMGATAMLLRSLSSTALRMERDKITAEALAQAKEALIGYAANNSTPGKLPCPENIPSIGTPNEGQAQGSCSNTLPTIGRLPWRTLGLGPLRDGNGEVLWYVLSPGFQGPTPINSDTPAQLTVDGIPNSAVAIIFSAGAPINGQAHPPLAVATAPDITQYLELSNNDGDNTFVSTGPSDTFNDRLLVVTHNDLFRVVEKRITKEVTNALNEYYCGFGNVNPAGGCIAAGGNRYYPRPADFTDASCLGNLDVSANCNSLATINKGRIPASLLTNPWDPTSILRGVSAGNWFQSNAWREVIFYAVSTACTDGTSNCSTGSLSLNNPPGAALSNQKVVVIATGNALPTTLPTPQDHSAGKNTLSNYLEEENMSPLDDVYTRNAASAAIPFNDIATSIP